MKKFKQGRFAEVSIRTRLMLFYSIAAFALLTVITLFLYWETINILYRADYQFLCDEVETLQTVLAMEPINTTALKQEVIGIPTETHDSIYRYFIRIIDPGGRILIETPGISKVLPKELQITTFKNLSKHNYRRYSTDSTNYLMIQSPVTFANKKNGSIQIILNISYQHTVMSDRKFLFIALILSALSSLFIGFFVTMRGMRSLYELTDTTKKITATSLHQRIDPKSLPKDLRALGIAFNQMLDRIESSFVRLKQFSSDLAHELRSPINNLIGETEIALSHHQTTEEYQQVLISNMEEYNRISHLIENILFLSRAENPQLEIQKTLLNVRDEIAIICDYYQAMADDKQIPVTYDGHAQLHLNSIMFRRMISNLLSNALKYTPNKGWIKFNIISLSNSVQIKLSDNGIGIPEEHLPKLFDRFYRVDTARAQQSGGIGLGLAIVKSIVDLHQGNISISSQPGYGTSILLTFPK